MENILKIDKIEKYYGNKSNNLVSNLESCTPSENSLHASKTGLSKKHYINSTNIRLKCLENNTTYISIKQASRELHIDYNYLYKCVHSNKKCKGFHFIII